jgi:hypothetical protein
VLKKGRHKEGSSGPMNNNIMNKDIIIEFNCVSTLRVSGIYSRVRNRLHSRTLSDVIFDPHFKMQ